MSAKRPDKSALLTALCARVNSKLDLLRASQKTAQQGAVHDEMRQEDPKDTRAIEAQYFARGLSEQVESLQDMVGALTRMRLGSFEEEDPIGLSALVGLDGSTYFIVPAAGGESLTVDGTTVRTLTPASPLGEALCGSCVDEEIELQLPGRNLSAIVEWVE